jgi:hypothetical protein
MIKAILILVLGLLSNSVLADWAEVGKSNDATVYADSSTIRSNEDNAKMWLMYDFSVEKIMQGHRYLSEKRLNEYDCKTEEVRSHAKLLFSQSMGSGELVLSDEAITYWKLIDPGSAEAASLKVACTKFYEFWKWDWNALKQMITPERSVTEF